ncbi:MAG: glycoside hydrolase [Actinomycetota bacterium]|nr:glycoside hydrolase [Actinomycetota bacterium]
MRRGVVAVTAVAALAAVALSGWALLSPRHSTVGRNVFVNPPGIIDGFSTPTIVTNPRNPNEVAVTYREDRPNLTASLSWSTDRGGSFHQTNLPLPAGLDRPFFPDAAFAPDGTLYVAYANLIGPGNVPGNLWVARSPDAGRTLSTPTLVATAMTFQPRITIGAGRALNLTWLQSNRVMGQPAVTGGQVRVMMAHSPDGGRTWSTPSPVNPEDGRLVSAASAAVDRSSIVVAYERFGPTADNLGTGGTTPQPDTYDIVVTRSGPGGTGFSPPAVVAANVRTTQRFSLFFPQFPSLAAAPDGSLYLTWSQGRAKGQDALVARSQDLGTHWSPPVRANDNPAGDGTARSLPTLSVAPNGRVDVVMIDQRNDPSGLFAEAYLATSTDGARSFHDVRLSSATFDTRVGPSFGGNLPPDIGSHLSVVSQRAGVQAAWADSRLGTETTARQDIVTAHVSVPGTGLGSRKWLLVAAGVLLLGAAAVLLVSRRRA